MKRPYIICHMMTSIDGKIDGDFFDDEKFERLGDIYEEIKLKVSDAWGNGSNTHKMYFGNKEVDFSKYNTENVKYEDKVAVDKKNPYVVCFDRTGKVNWENNYLEYPDNVKNKVVEVLTKSVRKEFIAYLDSLDISYIFAGEKEIDLNIAMEKLYELFNIKTFAITGGSIINGAFLNAGLIDEISLVIAPVVSGNINEKTIIDGDSDNDFKLKETKILPDNGLHLTYKK